MGHLHLGDNLPFMQSLPAGSVQLVYADPPFGTNRSMQGSDGSYPDRWESPAAYVEWMRPRLQEMHRVLREDGSLYLHLDRRSVHHARLLLDDVFGPGNFQNEIIWHYTGGGRSRTHFPHKHDNILVYHKSARYKFNADAVREPYAPGSGYARGGIVSRAGKRYSPHALGKVMDDVWHIPIVNPMSRERTGYPTQKPEALLARILAASTDERNLVLDPFCGSGTTAVVAERMNRDWIAVDVCSDALEVTRSRLGQSEHAQSGGE